MDDTLNLSIGGFSRNFFSELTRYRKNHSNNGIESELRRFDSILIDDKKSFCSYASKFIDIDNNLQIYQVDCENSNNQLDEDAWYDKTSSKIEIPCCVEIDLSFSSDFIYLEYFESEIFAENFEEEMQRSLEKFDFLQGINIFLDTHSHLSLSLPIINEILDDEYRNTTKTVVGFWDVETTVYSKYLSKILVNSLTTLDSISYNKTAFIPLSCFKFINKKPRLERIPLSSFMPFKMNIDDAKTSSQIFSYVYYSLFNSIFDENITLNQIVNNLTAGVWGSNGTLASISFAPFNIDTDDNIFSIMNCVNSYSDLHNLCSLSFGYLTPQPCHNSTSYMISSLNNHHPLNYQKFEREIHRYKWSKSIYREYTPNVFSSERMLKLYFQHQLPGTLCEIQSLSKPSYDLPQTISDITSISTLYTGSVQAHLLHTLMENLECTKRISHLIPESKKIELTNDGINEYLNSYSNLINTVDPDFSIKL